VLIDWICSQFFRGEGGDGEIHTWNPQGTVSQLEPGSPGRGGTGQPELSQVWEEDEQHGTAAPCTLQLRCQERTSGSEQHGACLASGTGKGGHVFIFTALPSPAISQSLLIFFSLQC
jgi:hypothetical protein